MNFKEGFKPNKINLIISAIIGIIFGWLVVAIFCGGGTGIFRCGFLNNLIAMIIIFVLVYILISIIISFFKK